MLLALAEVLTENPILPQLLTGGAFATATLAMVVIFTKQQNRQSDTADKKDAAFILHLEKNADACDVARREANILFSTAIKDGRTDYFHSLDTTNATQERQHAAIIARLDKLERPSN